MEQMPFEPVIGRCRLIEVPTTGDQITAEDLQKFKFSRGQRVLLKTRNSAEKWAEKPFNKDFVSIRADAAQFLVDQGVLTVGVDYLSVGGYERDGVQTHQILLGAGVWVIEGLDLSEAKPGFYNLICLPLKLVGADGAPCRVVIR
jgi:arylformamidase